VGAAVGRVPQPHLHRVPHREPLTAPPAHTSTLFVVDSIAVITITLTLMLCSLGTHTWVTIVRGLMLGTHREGLIEVWAADSRPPASWHQVRGQGM
jgi:hypothetical protein